MFSEINQELVTYVKEQVSEVIWEKVMKTAAFIDHAVIFGLDPTPLKLAVLLADIFEGDPHHANKAYLWVREHLASYGYGEHTNLVARMVHEHSASFTGTYTNKYCQFMAAINYGPFDIPQIIKNTYQHFYKTTILPIDGILDEMVSYFKTNWLPRYKRPNPYYDSIFMPEIAVDALRTLTQADLKTHL